MPPSGINYNFVLYAQRELISSDAKNYRQSIKSMIDSLSHRGPDGLGFYDFSTCNLGHSRLSIIDLESGDQPMVSPDNKRAVVFNGEIYNYKEIKNEYSKDYAFRSHSDTEVLLALYRSRGVDS